MKLKEFAPQFLELHNDNKPQYLKNKTAMLEKEIIPRFGEKDLAEITALDVDIWIAYLRNRRKLSNRTINNYTTIFRNLLRVALEYNLIKAVPVVKRQKPEESFADYLKHEQVALFINAMPTPMFQALARVGLNTGLRIGELRALMWENVDFDRGILVVRWTCCGRGATLGTPKGRKSREVPMNREVVDTLKKLDRGSKFVFMLPSRKGRPPQPLSYKALECAWRHPRRVLGAPWIDRHTMRHTFASHLALAGAGVIEIKELLGHVDISTTMRYAKLRPSALHGTVALLQKM